MGWVILSVVEDLEKLKALKDNGAITETEFEIEKSKILNSNFSNGGSGTDKKEISNNMPLSMASFVCGIVSIFILPFIFGIVAVILGIIGIAKPEEKKVFAISGIIIGILGVLWAFYSTGIL